MPGVYNEIELAWLAGIVDGEGTITLVRHNRNKFRSPVISVASTTYELLLEVQRIAGGGSISSKKVYATHHKPSWTWALQRRKALALIEALIPYLREPLKLTRAQFLLSNYSKCTSRNGKYTKEQLDLKEQMENSFFSLS